MVKKKVAPKTKEKASTSKPKPKSKVTKSKTKEKAKPKPKKVTGFDLPVKKDKATMKRMLEVGLHFGHTSSSWNPKMKKYIFTERNKMHILDLTQTIDALKKACEFLTRSASEGEVIFVGTKKQAQETVETAAKRCGAFYVTRRWPGGFLTNFKTLSTRVKRLDELTGLFEKGIENRTKKELMDMKKTLRRLFGLYGGLRGIKRQPRAIVVVDTKVENIAVREANKMKIPVVALLDTNSDPEPIRHPIPGNDDATKSIKLVIETLANAVVLGNKGNGVQHEAVDFNEIDARILNMLEEMRKKKEREIRIQKKPAKTAVRRKSQKGRIIKKK